MTESSQNAPGDSRPSLSPELIEKLDRSVPRYTSHPAIVYWPKQDTNWWQQQLVDYFSGPRFAQNQYRLGVYVHIPFCATQCAYCGCQMVVDHNKSHQHDYIYTDLKEWRHVISLAPHKPRLQQLHFGGGTPTAVTPDDLGRLAEGILELVDRDPDAELSLEADPRTIKRAHWELMCQVGINRVSLGVQDFSEEVQHIVKRHQSVAKVTHSTRVGARGRHEVHQL